MRLSMPFSTNKAMVKDFAEGVTAPPFHPRCRTTTMPAVDDEWMEGTTRIARGADGKTYSVPADMKYEDWKKKFAKDATPEPKHNGKQYQKQFAKYKAIFGKEIPSTLGTFQEMKYNNSNKWGTLKVAKQEKLNQMTFEEMGQLVGKLGNGEARLWYKTHMGAIAEQIKDIHLLEERAREAFELRQCIRSNTRELMADEKGRAALPDRSTTFEKLLLKKMERKGLSKDEALEDIIRSSVESNAEYDKKAGLR
ncbi:MAG: hypothetical protein RSB80_03915 [Anaerovoracaceae bacterium]